jgi:methyltransferase (TIGR00027 family)
MKFVSLRHCHETRPQGTLGDIEPELPRSVRAMFDYLTVRTVFLRRLFTAAAASGIRQAVILGSGLDARAWRLRWPDGTTVYEIDQAKVVKFESATLAAQPARPAAGLINVAADLRHHWPRTLRRAGHEPDTSLTYLFCKPARRPPSWGAALRSHIP